MLAATNLSFSYGKNCVLKDISLTLRDGEIVCLLGPSGCGKTTLINLLAGIAPLQTGRIETTIERPGPKLGHMTQESALLPWLSAQDNVCLAGRLHPQIQKPTAAERHGAFKAFGLQGLEKAFPDALSGGQKQRLILMRTLLSKPSLLLLDEPMGQLDAACRLNLAQLVRNHVLEHRAAALVVTHQLDVAVVLADTILLLDENPARIAHSYPLTDEQTRKEALYQLSADMMQTFHAQPEEAA